MATVRSLDAVRAGFERRAERAAQLALGNEASGAPLTFAAGLYRAQAALAGVVAEAHGQRPLSGSLGVDGEGFVAGLRGVLRFAAASGPPGLAEAARSREREAPATLGARLHAFWTRADPAPVDYLSRALLQPYVATLARLERPPDRTRVEGSCPFCGGGPWIAARREPADGGGAQRYFGCSLCAGEWVGNRVRCVACSEENPARLASYTSARHPAVRLEACESCRRYVKSLDLTVDGRLIPEVDDLVSIAMDLWATDEGYRRIEPGLAGV